MDKAAPSKIAPEGWLESLARSEAQLAAGQIVSGEAVMRELYDTIVELEAKHADTPTRRATSRR